MTISFLSGAQLGSAIAEVVGGSEVRCAVAFWGTGAVEHLFGSGMAASKARIICDLSLGATNPDELRQLGAPANRRLRQIERLHAKVYLSKRGAVVCSANASNNGIGFNDVAGLVEAGVRLAPGTPAYEEARAWLRRLWRRAEIVDQSALDRATTTWNRRAGSHKTPLPVSALPSAPSLFSTVAANPARYRGIGFVFTTGRATIAERDEACEALDRRDAALPVSLLSRDDRRKLREWNVGDLFTGWSESDLDAWPRRFVCIHRPRRRASYWFYRRAHDILVDTNRGAVFAERPQGLRQALGFSHGREAMLATDGPMLERLFALCEKRGHWLCENGEALLELVDEARATR